MMRSLATLIVLLCWPVIAPCAAALGINTAIVDDSATVVANPNIAMAWRRASPKQGDSAIVGRTRVNVRLNTMPWIGKTAKIYMVLAPDSLASVEVNWRSHGTLLDGELRAGMRTLVYSGIIRAARLEDVLDVSLVADGIKATRAQRLRFHFEIDFN